MKYLRGLAWMIGRFGVRRTLRYERFRKRREREVGRKFDPRRDGEALARALGYGDAEVEKLREAGLA